jgi:hypothetical protein
VDNSSPPILSLRNQIFAPIPSLNMYKLWNPSDVVTLIAWLDFCVENGVDFYDTICERLSETRKEDASREFNFTGRQVYDKLNDLARRNHQPNPNSHYPSPTEIKERGSVCFPGLQDPIRKDVQALKQIYRIQYAGPLQHEQSTGDRQVQGVTSAQISQVGPGVNKKGTPGKRVPNSRRNTQHVTGTRPPREDQGTATLTPNVSLGRFFRHVCINVMSETITTRFSKPITPRWSRKGNTNSTEHTSCQRTFIPGREPTYQWHIPESCGKCAQGRARTLWRITWKR